MKKVKDVSGMDRPEARLPYREGGQVSEGKPAPEFRFPPKGDTDHVQVDVHADHLEAGAPQRRQHEAAPAPGVKDWLVLTQSSSQVSAQARQVVCGQIELGVMGGDGLPADLGQGRQRRHGTITSSERRHGRRANQEALGASCDILTCSHIRHPGSASQLAYLPASPDKPGAPAQEQRARPRGRPPRLCLEPFAPRSSRICALQHDGVVRPWHAVGDLPSTSSREGCEFCHRHP